jgi:hypothetical protein
MKALTRSGGVPATKVAVATTTLPSTLGKKLNPMRPPRSKPTSTITNANATATIAMRLFTAQVTRRRKQ